jgi:glycosyltransferase involved in cell wall biosynthesis
VRALRIAIVGGVPPSLGGGGLEVQLSETMAALARAGHEVFHVGREPSPRPFDVLHAIGAEPDICHWLTHWRRNPAPLVVSPVLVVPVGGERRERIASRLPLASFGPRMRRDLLARADVVVALTEHEAGMVRDLGARTVVTIPNGVTPVEPGTAPPGTPAAGTYALLLGSVSARKRQGETAVAFRGVPTVIAGGFDGAGDERTAFERTVAETGAVWLGEVGEPATVRALLRDARALVHLSRAEGQSLALLEALRVGTPIIVSRLPANLELAERHPAHVRVVDAPAEAAAAFAALGDRPDVAPQIPTWDDVAADLEGVYARLVAP